MEKDTLQLVQKIEAILFYLAEPVSINFLSKTLEVPRKEVLTATVELEESLKDRGIRILMHEDEVSLVTAPELKDTIERVIKEERERDLGRAGIETLAIVAYKGPVSKKEIEYIRGVNSQWALRNLLLRGLVERKNSEADSRVVVYSVTSDTILHLGLSKISDLPQYKEVKKELEAGGQMNENENVEMEENGK